MVSDSVRECAAVEPILKRGMASSFGIEPHQDQEFGVSSTLD